MDRDLAKLVALTAFRSSASLTELIPMLKEHCAEAEYIELRHALASASAEIGELVMKRMFSLYPDLKDEIGANVEKYGRAF